MFEFQLLSVTRVKFEVARRQPISEEEINLVTNVSERCLVDG